jgi:hypothetical protein
LLAETKGLTVVHLFGGQADFGTRLDIDPVTRPHVVGDAWLPPFAQDSFDVVILDPPYTRMNAQEKNALFLQAAYIARRRIIWFSTLSLGWAPCCRLERVTFVRTGNMSFVRTLEFFKVVRKPKEQNPHFTRGPAIRYNRWMSQPQGLPFGENK